MLDRRSLLAFVAVTAGAAVAGPAHAFSAQPFNQAAFDAALAAKKPVLLHVTAPWCPTCKAQKPILSKLSASPKFKDVVAFEIDFDTQKDLLRALNVRTQSTIIAYKGGKEIGRSTGDTTPDGIEGLLDKSV
jgi:thiol-disulfide isomerase/thioredoxin